MRYKTFIKVAPDGQISHALDAYVQDDYVSNFYPIEISDPEQRTLFWNMRNKCLYENGMIVLKPTVIFQANKNVILSNGVDEASVKVTNIPREYTQVKIIAAGNPVTLRRNEPLVVTATTPQRLWFSLNEEKLLAEPFSITVVSPP